MKLQPIFESNQVKVIMGVGRSSRLIYFNYDLQVSEENVVSITFTVDESILENVDQISIERSQDYKTYYTVFYCGQTSLKRIISYSDFSSNLYHNLWYRIRVKHKSGLEIITRPVCNSLRIV